jgi:hypothetical protein
MSTPLILATGPSMRMLWSNVLEAQEINAGVGSCAALEPPTSDMLYFALFNPTASSAARAASAQLSVEGY